MKHILSVFRFLLPSRAFLSMCLSPFLPPFLSRLLPLSLSCFLSLFLPCFLIFSPLAEAKNNLSTPTTSTTFASFAPFLLAKSNSSDPSKHKQETLPSSKDELKGINQSDEINRSAKTNRENEVNAANRAESSKKPEKSPPHARTDTTKTTADKQAATSKEKRKQRNRERKQRNREGRQSRQTKVKTATKQKKKQNLGTLEKASRRFTSLFPRTPKQTPEELMEELSTHIEELKSFCSASPPPDKEALQETLKQMKAFLEEKLNGDPYMDYPIKLKFGNMFDALESLLESPPLFSLDTFLLVYHRQYNLIEYKEEHSEDWVKAIIEAFKCLRKKK